MKAHQTFRLHPDLIEMAKKIAVKENRTLSNVYETAVHLYLTRHPDEYLKWRRNETKKRLGKKVIT